MKFHTSLMSGNLMCLYNKYHISTNVAREETCNSKYIKLVKRIERIESERVK